MLEEELLELELLVLPEELEFEELVEEELDELEVVVPVQAPSSAVPNSKLASLNVLFIIIISLYSCPKYLPQLCMAGNSKKIVYAGNFYSQYSSRAAQYNSWVLQRKYHCDLKQPI